MAVLPIYTDGSPVLRKKAKALKEVSDSTVQLIMDMFETMRKASGIGLAANQVGVLKRIIVIDISEVEGHEDVKPAAYINPVVVGGKDRLVMEEGCLSIPTLRDEVERDEKITIRYRDANFNLIEEELEGIHARVFLHEVDHLDGILFIDRLPPERQKEHLELLEKIQTGKVDVDYPIISAPDAAA